MPIQIVRNDITRMEVDAIVNTADSTLLGGGGVDGAIHRAAGPELLAECRLLGGCEIGEVKLTKGYRLPCKYVIHTVGPVWHGGDRGEKELLEACYRNSLKLAKEKGCETVAFPLISAGVYGYPREQAMRVAMDTARDFLRGEEMLIYIVVFDADSVLVGSRLYGEITRYIDDHYAAARAENLQRRRRLQSLPDEEEVISAPCMKKEELHSDLCMAPEERRSREAQPSESTFSDFGRKKETAGRRKIGIREAAPKATVPLSLEERLKDLDESFTQAVLRLIDEKGMTDVECYKRANLDRKLFSKLRSDIQYRPSKKTAVALAVALELTVPETQELLKKAGFALSDSKKSDVIIKFFIENGRYDIMEINETLFDFDQELLGA